MEITQTSSITITINGIAYTFANPHPIEDLINQLNDQTSTLALWQQRAVDTQSQIDNLNAQITALCVIPA